MTQPFLAHDDIPCWSGPSTFHNGNKAYELKWGTHEFVSMMQAMLGQNGPILEAGSGNCLVIAIYIPIHQAGLLIHLWRDLTLSTEAADLISEPLKKFSQLTHDPLVVMLTSNALNQTYSTQMDQAKQLIHSLAPGARFHDVLATHRGSKISVSLILETSQALLRVEDDYGKDSFVDYGKFPP